MGHSAANDNAGVVSPLWQRGWVDRELRELRMKALKRLAVRMFFLMLTSGAFAALVLWAVART